VHFRRLADTARALQLEEQTSRVLLMERDTANARLKDALNELQVALLPLLQRASQRFFESFVHRRVNAVQVAKLDVGVKLSSLNSLQSQYDKLQVKLQAKEREEKALSRTVSDAHGETATLRVRRAYALPSCSAWHFRPHLAHPTCMHCCDDSDYGGECLYECVCVRCAGRLKFQSFRRR
jgi:hypothetical protein